MHTTHDSITHSNFQAVPQFSDPFRTPASAAVEAAATPLVEVENGENVEISIAWGDSLLKVVHLSRGQAFTLGEADTEPDFVLSEQFLGARNVRVLSYENEPEVLVPAGARILGEGSEQQLGSLPLRGKTRLNVGPLTLTFVRVAASERIERKFVEDGARRALGFFGLASIACGAFVGALAWSMPAMGLTDEEGIDRDKLYLVQQYLNAAAERNPEPTKSDDASPDSSSSSAPASEGARGASGAAGRPNATTQGRMAIMNRNTAPALSRQEQIAEARDFGMIGLLSSMTANKAPVAAWGSDIPSGSDLVDARGGLWGNEIGDITGTGLGILGTDQGGGDHGGWIGMGSISTCGTTGCVGQGGFGKDFGRLKEVHKTSAPVVRLGNSVTSGSLPAEVVQRVVRQNYGRFRQCYEMGLVRNPNLSGRVEARFVIERDGSVGSATNGGSDLPDSAVVSCVVSAYYSLSFPPPSNGIVRVTYPIMFSPAG
jgi:hypothetical protein